MSAGAVWKSFLPARLSAASASGAHAVERAGTARGPRVLLVVPHPDDEYYFAATVYRIATELGGTVDQIVITDGAGGHEHVQLAERFYGIRLRGARRRLARIRRDEMRRAARVLGIRRVRFLDQNDERYTLDAEEGLSRIWDRARVERALRQTLEATRYDFVFTILPSATTHGHHKSAAVLTLDAVQALPAAARPVVLAAEPGSREEPPAIRLACAASVSAEPVLEFDRTRRTAAAATLPYSIVVNWVIAEHKSQGVFQGDYGRHDVERYWTLGQHTPAQLRQLDQLRQAL